MIKIGDRVPDATLMESTEFGDACPLPPQNVSVAEACKGKRIVEIDSGLMRRKRAEAGVSLSELSERVGLAKESLHRFEGGARTSLETAKKLEEFFHCSLIKRAEFLSQAVDRKPEIAERELFPAHFEDELLQKIRDLGVKLAEFHRSPFDAFTAESGGLLIGRGDSKADIHRKALALEKSGETLATHSIIITKEFKGRKVEDIPVIGEDDLDTVQKVKDLVKLIREREKQA